VALRKADREMGGEIDEATAGRELTSRATVDCRIRELVAALKLRVLPISSVQYIQLPTQTLSIMSDAYVRQRGRHIAPTEVISTVCFIGLSPHPIASLQSFKSQF
jgi:hypothetical protein